MKVESYAFLGLSIFSSVALIIAVTFFIIGACSLAPVILAVLILGTSLLIFIRSLPKDKNKPKKAKKQRKTKKEKVTASVE